MAPRIYNNLLILLCTISTLPFYGKCQVAESELFPFDMGEDTIFFFGDDDFTRHNLTVPFIFFNNTYESVFISGNGQVSFGEGISTFTPQCSPSTTPMIMSFWADSNNRVDRDNAKLLFRETTDRVLLRKAASDIFKAFPDFRGINLSWMFVVTWKELPFYGATSTCNGTLKRNTFQLVLTTDGIHSFALMYYNKIQWTTGTASQGSCQGLDGAPAKAGFDYGDLKTWYTIPGSCQNSIVNITQTSNINEPGKWVFRIDSNLKTAECKEFDGSKQKLRLEPSVVSSFGSVPLKLTGPCLTPNDTVLCVYGENTNIELEGLVTHDSKAAVCPMPSFTFYGRKTVTLKIISQRLKTYTGYLYVVNDNEMLKEGELKLSFDLSPTDNSTIFINVEWDPEFVNSELDLLYGAVDDTSETSHQRRKRSLLKESVDLQIDSNSGSGWKKLGVVKRNIDNTGSFRGPVDKQLVDKVMKLPRPELLTASVSRSFKNKTKRGKRFNKKIMANPVTSFVNFYETISLSNPQGQAKQNHLACKGWSYLSEPPPTDTLPCPPLSVLARIDENFQKDPEGDLLPFFDKRGAFSVQQKIPSDSKAGSQCVYDKDGNLIVGPSGGGGTVDRFSPKYSWSLHLLYDVVPFLYCCKLSGNLKEKKCINKYYKRRPSVDAANYTSPRVTRAVGDPHITTFDGLTYTFNPVGEYWMVKAQDSGKNLTFKMQARMEQYISPDGVARNASIFTAAAMEEIQNGDSVVVQACYTDGKILVTLDGENLDFNSDDNQLMQAAGLDIQHKSLQIHMSHDHVTITFTSGFSFKFSAIGPNENALNILGMGDSSRPGVVVEGLMGDCDGDLENDVRQPDGTVLPTNSTLQDIHYNFGLKWMVQEHESIFIYLPGKSYSDYYRPDFLPNFGLDLTSVVGSIPQSIIEACDGNNECLFDYVATGSQAIASVTKVASVEFDRIVQVASTEVKVCQSPSKWYPENGYAEMTNSLVGGTLNFFCDDGYRMNGGDVNCTCILDTRNHTYAHSYNYLNPDWVCNRASPFPITCVSTQDWVEEPAEPIQGPSECNPPPALKYGHVVGTNFSIGSEIELGCNDDNYDLFWKNCIFNGKIGLCKEFCKVTYTCVQKVTTSNNGGTTEVQAIWEGYAGDITHVACYSKKVGKSANTLRAISLLLLRYAAAKQSQVIPDTFKEKPYLFGC